VFLCERGWKGREIEIDRGREGGGGEHFSIAPTGLVFTKLGVGVMPILMESIPFCRDILILAYKLQ
jgi:hypothetical protein